MRRHRHSPWADPIFSLAAAMLCGCGAALISAAGLSALSYFVLRSTQFIGVFASASAAAGAFTAAYILGRYRRRFGLLSGIACGAALFAVLSAVGLFVVGAPAGIQKLLLFAAAGAVGGVMGVNSKRPKALM